MTETPGTHRKNRSRQHVVRSVIRWLVIGAVLVWSLAALILVAARWINPPTTAVHIERRFQAWVRHTPYRERYKFIPLTQISPDLQHAVIAAEDARFYQHHGFDWHEVQIAAENDLEGGRTRGASTITQQLVKNLFFGTGRRWWSKPRQVLFFILSLGPRHPSHQSEKLHGTQGGETRPQFRFAEQSASQYQRGF